MQQLLRNLKEEVLQRQRYDKWEAVYIERCTYGFGARLWKPTLETRQGAVVLAYNIQREDILPSEKAKAYKMKYEAMKHQGKKSGSNTLDEVGEAAGENAKKVQRYIWLSRLSDELIEMVDAKKLGFSQGVDISFLSEEAQQWVEVIIEEQGCNVSTVQSGKLKEYGKSEELTLAMVRLILTEEKPKERKVTLKADKISKYFSDSYSNEEIENIIISLLDKWREEGAV